MSFRKAAFRKTERSPAQFNQKNDLKENFIQTKGGNFSLCHCFQTRMYGVMPPLLWP